MALGHLALVEEADRMGREGVTLVTVSLPEMARCQRWLLTEVYRQLRGARPTLWDASELTI